MKIKKTPETEILRQKAVDLLKVRTSASVINRSESEALKLVYELEVHQIELEMQNEELLEAKAEIQESRQKYVELYDFAPVGYVTINEKGIILEANLTFCSLVGSVRTSILGRALPIFILMQDRDELNRCISTLSGKNSCTLFKVRLKNNQGGSFWSRIDFRSGQNLSSGQVNYNLAITDITAQKLYEESLVLSEENLEKKLKVLAADLIQANSELKVELGKRMHSQKKLRESIRKYKLLYGYLHKVREEERTDIARTIHDNLSQLLTTLKFGQVWIREQMITTDSDTIVAINNQLHLVDTCLEAMATVITDLRPTILDKLGLIPALKQLCADFQQGTGIPFYFRIQGDPEKVPDEIATPVYRVIQEALANVRNHSKATQISIKISRNPSSLLIVLKDNGTGITLENISNPASFGIIGMKERIAQLKGKITFKGIPGKGTTVTLRTPAK